MVPAHPISTLRMETEGPPLEVLLRRLVEVPEDFLQPPRIGQEGDIVVAALVHDLAEHFGIELSTARLAVFEANDVHDQARLIIASILCWLLHGEWLAPHRPTAMALIELLDSTARQLAEHAPALKYVRDPERREELARLALAAFGLRPAGESLAQAQDRLASVAAFERSRVLRASRAAEERARAVREALAKKAAEEAADKWTRE